jgi:vancomycin resistance protein VanJ
MAMIPAAIIAIIGRRRWLAAAAIVVLLLFMTHFGYLLHGQTSTAIAADNANQLRLMTYNTHYSNSNASEIAQLIASQQPDIIAMQEVTPNLSEALLPRVADTYPYSLYSGPEQRLLLLSRYPLKAQSTPEDIWRALKATITTPNGTLNVWNFHPVPTLKTGRWQSHAEAYKTIARAIAAEQGPQIVLGDFNTTDQSEMYALISDQLVDVHQIVGNGFGFTFPASDVVRQHLPATAQLLLVTSPVVRLDHILTSHHFTPLTIEVLPNSYGSDHLPVVGTIGLSNIGE